MTLADSQRLVGWKTALRALWAHPDRWVLGWGPETFPIAYRLHRTAHDVDLLGVAAIADHAHSLPLELLLTLGAAGTVAFVYLFWHLWENACDDGRAAMLGLLLMSAVEPVFFPAAALLALALGSRYQGKARYGMGGGRVPAVLCAVVAASLWLADFATWQSAHATGETGRRRWAAIAAINSAPTTQDLLVQLEAGRDILRAVRDSHPNDADANQLAVMECLSHGDVAHARRYAAKALGEDPQNPQLAEQMRNITNWTGN